MTEYVYGIFIKKQLKYIGRTNDLERREKEHRKFIEKK